MCIVSMLRNNSLKESVCNVLINFTLKMKRRSKKKKIAKYHRAVIDRPY